MNAVSRGSIVGMREESGSADDVPDMAGGFGASAQEALYCALRSFLSPSKAVHACRDREMLGWERVRNLSLNQPID